MSLPARYLVIETAISVVINVAISAALAWLIFGGDQDIAAWGPSGFVLDFVPQAFMIALMGSIVPALITRRRIQTGSISVIPAKRAATVRQLLLRALLIALGAVILFAGSASGLVAILEVPSIAFATLFAIKLAFGALVAVIATPLALLLSFGSMSAAQPRRS